jgi:hypothetical protein
MLVRSSYHAKDVEADQKQVEKIRSLVDEMARYKFVELLLEEE